MSKRYSHDDVAAYDAARQALRGIAHVAEPQPVESPVIETGWPALDRALGGGLPRGTMAEVFGPELCGKTRLVSAMCAHVLEAGGVAALMDVEGAVADDRPHGLYYSQPRGVDEAVGIVAALLETHAVDLIAVDSVAGMIGAGEWEGQDAGRFLASTLRRIAAGLRGNRACVVFTRGSQSEEEFLDQTWALGADWHTLALHAATRLRLARPGAATVCTTVKCKLAPAGQSVRVALGRVEMRG